MPTIEPLKLTLELDTSRAMAALDEMRRRLREIDGRRPSMVTIAATAAAAAATTRPISRRSLLGLSCRP